MERHPEQSRQTLYQRIAEVIEAARHHVAQTANLAMVQCYYQIGRMIVEDEQGGKHRAGYGEKTLQALSERLTERFGKGFSCRNLRLFRQFYQTYSPGIGNGQSPIAKLPKGDETEIWQSVIAKFQTAEANIGRENPCSPSFGLSWTHYLQLLRVEDPLARRFYEIEAAKEKWSVLTHQDIGQMQMYVHYYDRCVRQEYENPTIGILLCKEKSDAIVKMTLPENENIYAAQYKLYLPDAKLLQQKLREWIAEEEQR